MKACRVVIACSHRFYLTDEECKFDGWNTYDQSTYSFYLTDEECKCRTWQNLQRENRSFYLTDEECKYGQT